jgi:MFS family permease
MHDLGFEPRPLVLSRIGSELAEQTRVGVAHGWNQRGLRLLMISGMIRGAFIGWAFYAAQPYFLDLLDSDQIWVVGVITALMSLSTIAGNQLVEVLTRSCRRRSSLMIGGAMVATIGAVVMGVTDSFWVALPAFLMVTGSMGVISPVRQAYVHHVTPSEHRATVISFDAMLGSVGGVGGQLSLGRLSDSRSLSAGYVVGGAFTALAWPVLWAVRRIGGEADAIVPDGARDGTCAAQGLPRDTQTESHPREVVVASR